MKATDLLIFALPVILLLFLFSSQRKRQRTFTNLQDRLAVGQEVLTTSGSTAASSAWTSASSCSRRARARPCAGTAGPSRASSRTTSPTRLISRTKLQTPHPRRPTPRTTRSERLTWLDRRSDTAAPVALCRPRGHHPGPGRHHRRAGQAGPTVQWTPAAGPRPRGRHPDRARRRSSRAAARSTPRPCSQSVDIIRARIDGYGVAEAEITTEGGRNIIVAVPGKVSEAQRKLITQSSQLRFRPVLAVAAAQRGAHTDRHGDRHADRHRDRHRDAGRRRPPSAGRERDAEQPAGRRPAGAGQVRATPTRHAVRHAVRHARGAATPAPKPTERRAT